MDGTIIDKDDAFTVPKVSDDQPDDYPRTARVVGEDQPFNCRCSQAPVLREDMPSTDLTDFESASVSGSLSQRQLEVFCLHSDDGVDSFEEFWRRSRKRMGVGELADKYGMSKSTVYRWDDRIEKQGADV
jgi:hypothetical protein